MLRNIVFSRDVSTDFHQKCHSTKGLQSESDFLNPHERWDMINHEPPYKQKYSHEHEEIVLSESEAKYSSN